MSAIIPIHLYLAAGNINICTGVNEPNPRLNKQKFASLHLLIAINIRNCQALVPNPKPISLQSLQTQSHPNPTQFETQINPKGPGADTKIL